MCTELYPFVSIIIPCSVIDKYTRECLAKFRKLDYPGSQYEIIVLPDTDRDNFMNVDNIKVYPTGPLTPGAKRNIGIKMAKGEILAFIDSDAYPRKDWLKNAMKYLDDPLVAGVGGPGITPDEDSLLQKASGHVFSSFMIGGLSSRYKEKHTLESDDIHSCNFITRKEVLKKVGEWNEKYWPGEDTLICLAIRKAGKKLIEASDVVVYHHRKPLFKPHLKQVAGFGLHRGFFFKRFPENSRKITYLLPSIFITYLLLCGAVSLFLDHILAVLLMLSVVAYLVSTFAGSLHAKQPKLMFLTWLGIIATHVVYGICFLTGLCKRELKR